jgi:uncharacterized membrane protein
MLLVLAAVVAAPLLLIWLVVARSRRIADLERRLKRLERIVEASGAPTAASDAARPQLEIARLPLKSMPVPAEQPVAIAQVVEASLVQTPFRPAISLEAIVGGRALGWAAVIVLLFATAFFLRYAFKNQWIGPIGRVSLGILAGLALTCAGRVYDGRGWRAFSQMLTAGGIVLIYLAMYGAFGFYHLIEQQTAGVVLFLLVVEAVLLAVRYEAPAIALMAVLGGLLTPILMHSERDQYVSLFIYLAVLNGGFVLLVSMRDWPAIGTVSLVGTQYLFWNWHAYNYHPEKLGWALGFQLVIYVLFLLNTIAVCARRPRAGIEDLIRLTVNAAFWFAAVYVLLDPDYHEWLGSAAVGMAALYALVARWLLMARSNQVWPLLIAVGIAAGFIGLAIPLQADAPWVALGWAAEAGVMWWFGVRVRALPLRAMAFVVAVLAVGRILFVDTPWFVRPLFTPIFNKYATPALCSTACLGLAMVAARRWLVRLSRQEQVLAVAAAIGCLLLVWFIVSADVYGYFRALAQVRAGQRDWQWLGQTWLSAWWTVYATLVLAAGFVTRQAWLRWTGLGLYAITIGKVFLVDMAGVDELYRVMAFFVLEFITIRGNVTQREAVRTASGPGSAWIIDLGVDRFPCEQIEVEVEDAEFARDYVVEVGGTAGADQPFVEVASGQWSRRAGERQRPLNATFPEHQGARLRLVVTDYSNPPLQVSNCRVLGAARQLVFARSESLKGPLRLYYGNPNAEPPHYDLERNLKARIEPPPARLNAGLPQDNPDYVAEPKPLTERFPWLIYVILGSASAVLTVVIVSIGRTAVARDVQRETAESAAR